MQPFFCSSCFVYIPIQILIRSLMTRTYAGVLGIRPGKHPQAGARASQRSPNSADEAVQYTTLRATYFDFRSLVLINFRDRSYQPSASPKLHAIDRGKPHRRHHYSHGSAEFRHRIYGLGFQCPVPAFGIIELGWLFCFFRDLKIRTGARGGTLGHASLRAIRHEWHCVLGRQPCGLFSAVLIYLSKNRNAARIGPGLAQRTVALSFS